MTREEELKLYPHKEHRSRRSRKSFYQKKALEEAISIQNQKRTELETQVKKILTRFISQQNYKVTPAAIDIVNLFNEGKASDKIATMVVRLNHGYVVPEKHIDVVMRELNSIGVYYDEQPKPKASWEYLPIGKEAENDE